MRVPVGSYPHERWAREISDLLSRSGIDATIKVRGPRAYQVLVPQDHFDHAGEILESMGYFSCPLSRPTLGGTQERPPFPFERRFLGLVETAVLNLAETQAARKWSEPDLETILSVKRSGYGDLIVYALFGKRLGRNGKHVQLVSSGKVERPRGWELLDSYQVKDSMTIERTGMRATVLRGNSEEKLGMERGEAMEYVDNAISMYFGDYPSVSIPVSGVVDVLARRTP